MIGEYLSQTNESATVLEAKIFCKLNKALVYDWTIFVKYKRNWYYSHFAKYFASKQSLNHKATMLK